MKDITYIFKSGRLNRIDDDNEYAKEFFYSYTFLKNKYKNLAVIEDKEGLNKRYLVVEKILRKFNLPIFYSKIINKKNLNILKNSDVIFSTNPGLALTISSYVKRFKRHKNLKFITINSGIFTNIYGEIVGRNFVKNFFIKRFLNNIDVVIFTSKTEHKKISKIFNKFSHKFIHKLFSIDTEFWKSDLIPSSQKKEILFIGNNAMRDFEKVIEIVKKLPDKQFKIISSFIDEKTIPKNAELIKGDWNKNILSDLDIKKLYNHSRLVFLPLADTLVASGQSVAMQSMTAGTPVIISKTTGFWDFENFINKENIFFVEDNSVQSWVDNINSIYDDCETLDKVAKNGQKLIEDQFNISEFTKFLENLFD